MMPVLLRMPELTAAVTVAARDNTKTRSQYAIDEKASLHSKCACVVMARARADAADVDTEAKHAQSQLHARARASDSQLQSESAAAANRSSTHLESFRDHNRILTTFVNIQLLLRRWHLVLARRRWSSLLLLLQLLHICVR